MDKVDRNGDTCADEKDIGYKLYKTGYVQFLYIHSHTSSVNFEYVYKLE